MEPAAQKPSLLAIVGPTASGKSGLAMKVAQKFNGEIIAADSRTIYIGMDIGTAKPSKIDQSQVPHWGLDLVKPGQSYSAYQFKEHAKEKIKNVQKRGKLPILVGGTGLYVDSILFDFGFVNSPNFKERKSLERLTTEQLQELIKEKQYPMPSNYQNRRHLIRTIEREGEIGTSSSIKDNNLIIGLLPPPATLRDRINSRANRYFKNGLLKETRYLVQEYGEQKLMRTGGIAYIAATKLLKKEATKEEALNQITAWEWQYARRQRTWFRRNKFIRWFNKPEQAYLYICSILNN